MEAAAELRCWVSCSKVRARVSWKEASREV